MQTEAQTARLLPQMRVQMVADVLRVLDKNIGNEKVVRSRGDMIVVKKMLTSQKYRNTFTLVCNRVSDFSQLCRLSRFPDHR